jgi:hypothetical protein
MLYRPAHSLMLIFTLIMIIAPDPSTVFSQSAKISGPRTEKVLHGVFERLLKAAERKDEKTLREILTNDYTQVTADGRIRSKEDRVKETIQSNDSVTLFLEDFRVRSYKTAAIALCRVRQEVVSDGKTYKSTILSTVTFIRQGGTWRIAATHLTFAKE